MGWLDSHAISALHGRGTGDLLDAIVGALPAESAEELERKEREAAADDVAAWPAEEAVVRRTMTRSTRTRPTALPDDGTGRPEDALVADLDADAPVPRIAIVGRPNVGKSSLLNQLLGEERAIVSDIPGTTRDAIDTALEWQGRALRLVDTAGLRRRGKVAAGPAAERYSALRALKAIGRADVCVLVLDARDGLTAQDAHVAGYVVDEGVGLVVALNKWDLVEKDEKTFEQAVDRHPPPDALPPLRAGPRHQRPDRPARGTRPRRGRQDRCRTTATRAHGAAQPGPLRRGIAAPALRR